jgi:Golgi SNAP receptor complex protein 1
MSSWESLQKQAKYLESKLEAEIQSYSAMAQKINADFLCDEENPLLDSREEHELSVQIDRNLNELADCIQKMKLCPHSVEHQEHFIRRYSEINMEYKAEHKSISQTIQRKKESMELFKSSKLNGNKSEDSAVSKLLRERSSIAASMKSINDMISQAFNAKESLTSQRSTLGNASGGLSNISSSAPSFSRLIESMHKKKCRESLIVGTVIGLLTCFTIWWVFLR